MIDDLDIGEAASVVTQYFFLYQIKKMENWSISDLVEEDWSISDIVEANEKRYVRERGRLMKRKRPLANLSVTELEQMRQEALRIIAACGLCPEGEIESAQERLVHHCCLYLYTDLQTFDLYFFFNFVGKLDARTRTYSRISV